MDKITAISNAKIQHLRKLLTKKDYRYDNQEYVVEGVNIVDDMPKSLIKTVFVTEDLFDKYSSFCDEVYCVCDKVMNSVSDTCSSQGVMVIASMVDRETQLQKPCVVLDNISDPGNVGTIMRSAVACGIGNIVLYGNTCDPYSPKVVRSSMGGIFHLAFTTDLPENIVVLDMVGENIFEATVLPNNFALVVGNESHGVSKALREMAIRTLSLPMASNMESLNAAISLSVALYNIVYCVNKQ